MMLANDEIPRLATISASQRRGQFVAGRQLARHLLCAWTPGSKPADWAIESDDVGRPWAVNNTQNADRLHLSISHSGDRVACALADHAVGVDIEALPPRRSRDLDGLMQGVGSPSEIVMWNGTCPAERSTWFYRLWVVKESWLKARGEGVTLGRLQQLCIRLAKPEDEWVTWCRATAEEVLACHASAIALASPPSRDPLGDAIESWWAVDDLAADGGAHA